MIGPGTGVAPFIGFLRHREALCLQAKTLDKDTRDPSIQNNLCFLERSPISLDRDPSASLCGDPLPPLGSSSASLGGDPSASLGRDPLAPLGKDPSSASLGKAWLFFGCRNPDTDHIYKEEMEHFVDIGCLNRLNVAYSRSTPYQTKPSQAAPTPDETPPIAPLIVDRAELALSEATREVRYVQDLMRLHWKALSCWLLEEKAYVFVCGCVSYLVS